MSTDNFNLADIMRLAIERGSSDIHLTAGLPPMLRVIGKLEPTHYPRLRSQDIKRLIYGILNDKQKEIFEKNWELDLSYGLQGQSRFRVNVFKQRGSVAVALRAIPETVPLREELDLPAAIDDIADIHQGLILVTGPTGVGKSTTLACIIDQINRTRSCHILTVEDPIEYIHEHKKSMINQRELGHDTQSWTNALRSVLREDPDVILVGEMRDLESISLTITAAETGHLVLTTLHTSDAAQTVDRIIDVFPPHQQQQIKIQLSSVIQGVISQQLIPHISGIGRVPAVEIMIATPGIRNLIREGKTHQLYNSIQTGAKYRMQTMEQALLELYKNKKISYEEAISRTTHREELRRLIDSL